MKEMTSKERIDAVLTGQPFDRTPFALVDCGAWTCQTEGVSYRQLYSRPDSGAASIVKWTDEFGTDIVSGVAGVFTAWLNAFGCSIDIDKVGCSIDTGSCIDDPDTQIPQLDKSKIREMLEANEFAMNMVNQCKHVKELVGDRKYILVDIAGPFTVAAMMRGTEAFMLDLMMKPDLMKQLIDFTTAASTEMFRMLHEVGADIALPAEPVASGSMISPKMFKKWAAPAIQNLKDNLPEYKYFFTHVCGDSGNRMKTLHEIGVNAFSGDYMVDLDQALTDGEGSTIMMGNINPAGVLMTGSAKAAYEEACDRIRIANGRGHILATGCDMAAETPYDNILALAQACKDMAAND